MAATSPWGMASFAEKLLFPAATPENCYCSSVSYWLTARLCMAGLSRVNASQLLLNCKIGLVRSGDFILLKMRGDIPLLSYRAA
jgi:hypothetical protein